MINLLYFVSSILEISIVFYIGWVYALEPFCFLFDLALTLSYYFWPHLACMISNVSFSSVRHRKNWAWFGSG